METKIYNYFLKYKEYRENSLQFFIGMIEYII